MSAMEQFLLTLRFYATGSMLIASADFTGVHKSTASRTVKKVTRAIAEQSITYINLPTSKREIGLCMQEFHSIASFPRVFGCIDCTHVKIISPGGEEPESFRNRKGYFSLNVQVVCDAQMKIADIVTRWPGSTHDQTIFNNSSLKNKLENKHFGNGVLLGDSGYKQENYLMTPIRKPTDQYQQSYNASHIKTRNIIERMFGVWKRRFPILSNGMKICLDTAMEVVVACAVLHNVAVISKNKEPPHDITEPAEVEEVVGDQSESEEDIGAGKDPFIKYFHDLTLQNFHD